MAVAPSEHRSRSQHQPGPTWLKAGKVRLDTVGETEFLSRTERWFHTPEGEVRLTPCGSNFLRVLVWYFYLVPREIALPIVSRLTGVRWKKVDPAVKVIGSVARMLAPVALDRLDQIHELTASWAGEVEEVRRLEKKYFPVDAARREEAERIKAELFKQKLAELGVPRFF